MICAGKSNVEIQVRRSALTAKSTVQIIFFVMCCLLIHLCSVFYECLRLHPRNHIILLEYPFSFLTLRKAINCILGTRILWQTFFGQVSVERLSSLVQHLALRAASPPLPLLYPDSISRTTKIWQKRVTKSRESSCQHLRSIHRDTASPWLRHLLCIPLLQLRNGPVSCTGRNWFLPRVMQSWMGSSFNQARSRLKRRLNHIGQPSSWRATNPCLVPSPIDLPFR